MRNTYKLFLLVAMGGAINPVIAVPVVPNFQQGSMTTHTETTSTVVETINSMDYNTGYQWSVTGNGVTTDDNLSPTNATQVNNIEGVNSTWTGISDKPNFTLTTPGAAFQYTETYMGPGLSNHTVIHRETTVTSVTDTTSIFSQ